MPNYKDLQKFSAHFKSTEWNDLLHVNSVHTKSILNSDKKIVRSFLRKNVFLSKTDVESLNLSNFPEKVGIL